MADEAQKSETEKLAERAGRGLKKLWNKVVKVAEDPEAALAAAKAKGAEIVEKIEKGAQEFEKNPKASFRAAVDKAGAAIDSGIEAVAGAANKALGEEKPEAPKDEAPKGPAAGGGTPAP